MDNLQTTFTSLAVIAIVVLMVVFVCHYLGPRATAWVRSNREEKIGLSKSKLFNANGYMIHSGSDFLLSSTGSFKRFDSIDRDYKQVGQSSLTSPAWNIPQNDIPPQPLRPAPAPTPTQLSTKCKEIDEKSYNRQKSLETEKTSTSAIPRPVAKKQFSTPIKCSSNSTNNPNSLSDDYASTINLSEAVEKIQNNSRMNTNPFLNGTLTALSVNSSSDNLINCDTKYNVCEQPSKNERQLEQGSENLLNNYYYESTNDTIYNSKNPFTADYLKMQRNETKEFKLNSYEGPKTDVDRHNYFNFDPENITSMLLSSPSSSGLVLSQKQTPPKNIPLEHSNNQNEQQQLQQYQIETTETTTNSSGSQNKFLDSPCADAFENIEKMLKKHFRNRSFSDTETIDSDLRTFANSSTFFRSQSTNPFLDKNSLLLHKTYSENYLVKNNTNNNNSLNNLNNSNNNNNNNNNQLLWNFGRSTLPRPEQVNTCNLTTLYRRNSSQSSLDEKGSWDNLNLQRALSCDSVNSESSVVLSDLEQPTPQITGYLCIGLQYDKSSITDDGMELIVTVMEAKELIGPPNAETFDTFVRIYLVPDEIGAMQTKLFKNSSSPSYNETFCFWLNKKRGRHSLWFHLYHSGSAHTLIGEAEMQICDVSRPITTWLPLSDSRQNNANWGELMFSLSYLPTAERLTVVVVKARNLKLDQDGKETTDIQQNIFVKVYLLKNERKVSKKKTSLKRIDRCPIFNESMIFSIPPYVLNSIQVRLTVVSISSINDTDTMIPIGHVIVGSNTTGKNLRHWHQMLSSLRKPVAMWHPLRRTINNKGKNEVT